jgi:hypothetical protein
VTTVPALSAFFRVFHITASLVWEAFNFNVSMGFSSMDRQITIRRLLAIFMIAGLVLAPLARPVMAGPMSDALMSAMAEGMSVSATADAAMGEMPCCPSKAPTLVGCDKCVLMAACMDKCFTGLTAALFSQAYVASAQMLPPQSDFWPDGLGHSPPEHPPRTLV